MISTAGRALRRRLRPLEWVILEEVALDAVAEDGRLVAHTSARQVAERLGVDAGTAAGGLRVLRQHGLLELKREQGRAGRFGLSTYVLGSIPGLRIVSPCGAPPQVVLPGTANPHMVEPHTASGLADKTGRPSHSLQCPGQETLDLGATL